MQYLPKVYFINIIDQYIIQKIFAPAHLNGNPFYSSIFQFEIARDLIHQ